MHALSSNIVYVCSWTTMAPLYWLKHHAVAQASMHALSSIVAQCGSSIVQCAPGPLWLEAHSTDVADATKPRWADDAGVRPGVLLARN